jgi:general secretion pathway protein F
MPLYRYKAVSAAGATLQETIEAADEQAVVARLQALGHLPVRVEPAGGLALDSLLARDLFGRSGLGLREQADLARTLGTLLGAGLPLDRALDTLIELADRAPQRKLIERALERVRGGASLADALAAEGAGLPRFFVSLVRAGEAGGNLEQVLGRLAGHLERAQAVRDTVRSSLVYPAIVLGLSGLSIVILFAVVLPQFRPIFEDAGGKLPTITRVVLAISDGFERWWWLIALLACLAVLVGAAQLRRPATRARIDALLLRLPLVGPLVAEVEIARLARTLGTLLGNGVVLLSALGIAGETVTNGVLKGALETAQAGVKEGRGLAEPLRQTELFPPLAVRLIRVGEEAGRLDEMLLQVADIFDRQAKLTIDRLLAMLVPALTIGLGVVVALIIVSILSAMLSVYDLVI